VRLRATTGSPLDPEALQALRQAVAKHGARRRVALTGASLTAVTRAAAGLNVLAGTKSLLAAGLERLRATGGGQ
jgi:hypothetical protein